MNLNANAPYGVIIYTRYHGPTNTRGARIVASLGVGKQRLSLRYGDPASGSDAHLAAAKALLTKMHGGLLLSPWEIVAIGDNPAGSGSAFVFVRGTHWAQPAVAA